jgi:hypothetical protein
VNTNEPSGTIKGREFLAQWQWCLLTNPYSLLLKVGRMHITNILEAMASVYGVLSRIVDLYVVGSIHMSVQAGECYC